MRLGIVGISGLVGEKILSSLDILNIKYKELRVFASDASKGKIINFRNEELICEVFNLNEINNFDVLILAVENDIAKNIIENKKMLKSKTIIIDNSSEYRLDNEVPLVVPEINSNSVQKNEIIANPNCSTTMLVMLLAPLLSLSEIKKVNVSTYQAASGAGKNGLDELINQTSEIVYGKRLTKDYWKKQYIFNVFSHNSKITDNYYNQEEMKMVNETYKILDGKYKQKFIINPTCVRVPTLLSHCLSVNIEFINDVEIYQINQVLQSFPGIKIEDDFSNNSFPEPVKTNGNTDIFVGRIRPELDIDGKFNYKSYNFFISGDQLLKGAAYNSVQILKYIMDKK
jgi:aspartate-semialdehyde dehydrogenase